MSVWCIQISQKTNNPNLEIAIASTMTYWIFWTFWTTQTFKTFTELPDLWTFRIFQGTSDSKNTLGTLPRSFGEISGILWGYFFILQSLTTSKISDYKSVADVQSKNLLEWKLLVYEQLLRVVFFYVFGAKNLSCIKWKQLIFF